MAIRRQRTVKPRFFQDEELLTVLPPLVRWTFLGLQMNADDYGNESANLTLLKSQIWPMDDEITKSVLEDHLLVLAEAGYLLLYTVGKLTYYSVLNWREEWQTVDGKAASHIPPPPREPLATPSRGPREDQAVEERGSAGARGRRVSGGESEEGEGEPRDPSARPSPFCSKHPQGTERPCRACGVARLRHQQWMDDLMDSADLATELDPNGV
ncbi:hypothetical protein [Herbiconiux sp. VKM Ac-2851]|uniref:hypothetical protein n=1 Tax=Herbiconiux sp. VKM Ac-2851 TaxID=2739025 RepID=UPI001563BE40|nr:hypothetical protein [Herbiconiux sp. VKM Ac-2851]NQX36283.1 hypothetical protein [Herbiconiux sp. VKM Ac-2851]